MKSDVELRAPSDRQTQWVTIIRLAVVMSTLAALFAIVVSAFGDVSQAAIVIPVIVVAFSASWLLTGRAQRGTTGVVR